jgi:hypothetical protein
LASGVGGCAGGALAGKRNQPVTCVPRTDGVR